MRNEALNLYKPGDNCVDFLNCIRFHHKLPVYLYELVPPILNPYHNPGCYRFLQCRTDLFQSYFLPFSINEWSKLDPDIKTLDSHDMFHKKLLTFIKPSEKSIGNIYDPQRSKLFNRLRLGFSPVIYVNTNSNTTLQIL